MERQWVYNKNRIMSRLRLARCLELQLVASRNLRPIEERNAEKLDDIQAYDARICYGFRTTDKLRRM